MYSITQYISAAIHEGKIAPNLVIERIEDKHKAKTIEFGFNEEEIYKEAKKAESRNNIIKIIMIPFSAYILYGLFMLIEQRYFDMGDFLAMVFPALLIISIIAFIKQVTIDSYIKNNIKNKKEEEEKTNQQQNVIISGGYSPFSGYGFDLNSWSFTVNLKKPTHLRSVKPESINIIEMLDNITSKLSENINDLSIDDKLFVNGKDIRVNKMFMEGIFSKPNIHLEKFIISDYIGKSNEDVRHYRVITMPMWQGQVILSIFLRFIVIGDQLFVESRFFMLPPLNSNLMSLDNLSSKSGFSYYYGLIFLSFIKATVLWTTGIGLVLKWIEDAKELFMGDPENKKIENDDTYNYGEISSLRESWSTAGFQRYFQMIDKDSGYKISQHIIINSLIDYLESKGISTEDIKERQTTILNSGVMVTGGTINANQMAVGAGASAFINKITHSIQGNK